MLRVQYQIRTILIFTTIVASYVAGLQTAHIRFASSVSNEVVKARALATNALREKLDSDIRFTSMQIQLLRLETEMRLNESTGVAERVQSQLQLRIDAIKKELRANDRAMPGDGSNLLWKD